MALRRILAALGLAIAAAVFLPPQIERVALASDPYVFNDDARQWVVPFFDGALRDDWTSRYYRAITPVGMRALYSMVDPELLSKVLPFVTFAATCVFVAMTTLALTRSGTAATVSVCLLFSTAALMARMTGGSSRAFAYPILAAAAYGLATGRVRVIAMATIVGAAFYPPAGVIAGATLLFAIRKHWMLIAVVVVVSAALIAPMIVSVRPYGRGIGPDDVAAFPEAGPRGRYLPADRAPFPPVHVAAYGALDWGLRPAGTRFVPEPLQGGTIARAIALTLAGLGLLFLARTNPGARRLLLLPAASLLLYIVAAALAPRLYLPVRYVSYALVLLPAMALPIAAFAIERRRVALGICIALLLFLGGRGSATAGFTVNAHAEAALYERIAGDPGVTMIAGWPNGPVENVPYLSRKPALVTLETHQALHVTATQLMRARTFALIDAYFATSPEPLIRLREEFGVTHLLVDRRHFHGSPPRYFAPFVTPAMQGRVPEVSRHAPIFALGPYILLDLREVR